MFVVLVSSSSSFPAEGYFIGCFASFRSQRAQPGELELLKKHYDTSDEEQIKLLDKPEQWAFTTVTCPLYPLNVVLGHISWKSTFHSLCFTIFHVPLYWLIHSSTCRKPFLFNFGLSFGLKVKWQNSSSTDKCWIKSFAHSQFHSFCSTLCIFCPLYFIFHRTGSCTNSPRSLISLAVLVASYFSLCSQTASQPSGARWRLFLESARWTCPQHQHKITAQNVIHMCEKDK